MNTTLKDLGDFVIYLGAFAAALSAIGYLLYRVAWTPFVRTLRAELGATREAAEAVQSTAEAVHAEVTPNHGSSLKDAVTRTEQKVDQLDRRFTDHLINHPGG